MKKIILTILSLLAIQTVSAKDIEGFTVENIIDGQYVTAYAVTGMSGASYTVNKVYKVLGTKKAGADHTATFDRTSAMCSGFRCPSYILVVSHFQKSLALNKYGTIASQKFISPKFLAIDERVTRTRGNARFDKRVAVKLKELSRTRTILLRR